MLVCLIDFVGLALVVWAPIWRMAVCTVAAVGDFLLPYFLNLIFCSVLLFCFIPVFGNLGTILKMTICSVTTIAEFLSSCFESLYSYCSVIFIVILLLLFLFVCFLFFMFVCFLIFLFLFYLK